jgi:hypothetical protein
MDWLSALDQGASQGPFELLGLIGVEIITDNTFKFKRATRYK